MIEKKALPNIKENWSEIEGNIKSIKESSTYHGFYEIEIIIKSVRDVEGYKNFLKNRKNESILILISQKALEENRVEKGKKITCRVRVTAPPTRIFINPKFIQIFQSKQ